MLGQVGVLGLGKDHAASLQPQPWLRSRDWRGDRNQPGSSARLNVSPSRRPSHIRYMLRRAAAALGAAAGEEAGIVRIAVVGGGPGGLFFATLIRRADPAAEVTLF